MDTAMIGALLKAYGAPNTPENINALQQRYASDPTAAERKIYGLQGQSDESGGSRDAVLNMMIDQATPEGTATVGPPVLESVANSSVPTQRSATAARQPVDPRQLSNSPPSAGDPLANEVNKSTPAYPSAAPPASGGSGWEWLLPLLGIAAAKTPSPVDVATARGGLPTEYMGPEATYAGPMNKKVGPSGTTMRQTPTNRILEDDPPWTGDWDANHAGENQRDPGSKLISEQRKLDNRAPSTVTGSPENEVLARKAQVQAELDAGNAEANSIMNEMRRKKGGGGTNWKPSLARRAFGR